MKIRFSRSPICFVPLHKHKYTFSLTCNFHNNGIFVVRGHFRKDSIIFKVGVRLHSSTYRIVSVLRCTQHTASSPAEIRRWAEIRAYYAKIVHASTSAIPSFSHEIAPQQTFSIILLMSLRHYTQHSQWDAWAALCSFPEKLYKHTHTPLKQVQLLTR